MRIRTAVLGASLTALLALPAMASALTIQFTATDLTDTGSGDLWQYTYTVSGGPVNANEGFTIYFDYNLYSNLQNPQPVPSSDWDVVISQPSTSPPANGFFDALALVSPASLADPFTVEFVWLGGSSTTPGAQPFQTYACTDSTCSTVNITGSGSTVSSAIPEPPALALLMAGLIGLGAHRIKSASRFFLTRRTTHESYDCSMALAGAFGRRPVHPGVDRRGHSASKHTRPASHHPELPTPDQNGLYSFAGIQPDSGYLYSSYPYFDNGSGDQYCLNGDRRFGIGTCPSGGNPVRYDLPLYRSNYNQCGGGPAQ